jgi:hypothetical protein
MNLEYVFSDVQIFSFRWQNAQWEIWGGLQKDFHRSDGCNRLREEQLHQTLL